MKYEINSDTLIILPEVNYQAKVLERENEYLVETTPFKIMEHSCEYFGSSLEGRQKGSKNMIGSIYKTPILVEESRNLIFFPTISPSLEENIWISFNNIEKYYKEGNKTKVIFKNNKELVLDIPYHSFDNQVLRGARLESITRKRKEKISLN